MESFGKWVMNNLISTLLVFWAAFVKLEYWNWFIEPRFQTNLDIQYLDMVGITLFWGIFNINSLKFRQVLDEEKDKSFSDKMSDAITYGLVILVAWGFGWVYSLFIT